MRIHFIAIGGSIMHALAIDARESGHVVTGSDDEIYEPSRSKLLGKGLLPDKTGWNPQRITSEIDIVILGMHAKADNPELLKALELGLRIVSFPGFVAGMSDQKTRVVIAGSHGKTTTTSMIMHVLKENGKAFDYLVGARLEGFENMARISDAPIMIIEGDEYLSSALDRRPKFLHYDPDITVITGIEWDHMNVFPTEEDYISQFAKYVNGLRRGVKVFFDREDSTLCRIVRDAGDGTEAIGYSAHPYHVDGPHFVLEHEGQDYPVPVFGRHNMKNLEAARLVCLELGITDEGFYRAMATFQGAHLRLQPIYADGTNYAYLDFAHAPSKVKATVHAVAERHPEHDLYAILELHTYSSLNASFLPHYKGTMKAAKMAIVYYDAHTLAMKKLPPLDPKQVAGVFGGNARVLTDPSGIEPLLSESAGNPSVFLFMSSGNFSHTDLRKLCRQIFI